MKVPNGYPNGYHTTAAIGGKPSPGRISYCPLQTRVCTTRRSLGAQKQSDIAPSASKMITIARGTSHRPLLGWLPNMSAWPLQALALSAAPQPVPLSQVCESCHRFNEGRQHRCRYHHICSSCSGPHAVLQCLRRPQPLTEAQGPRPGAGQPFHCFLRPQT